MPRALDDDAPGSSSVPVVPSRTVPGADRVARGRPVRGRLLRGRRVRVGGATSAVPAPLLVFGGIVSVQVGAAVASGLFPTVGPAGAAALRLGLAGLILLPLVRPRVAGISRRDLGLAVGFGLVLGGMNLSFYEALDRLPLGVAVTVEFSGPLAVAVLASRRRQDLLWTGMAALGILLLARGGGAVTGTGIAFALLAGACWAGYITLSQRVGRTWPGLSGLTVAMVVAAALAVPLGTLEAGTALLSPGVLLAGLALALLSSVLPYSLELLALRRLHAGVFAVLMSLEPVVAALVGFLLLSQALSPRETLAVVVVVVACVGATRPVRSRPPVPEAPEA